MMGTNEFFYALIAAALSAPMAILAYRRSIKVDKVAEKAGIATETRAGTAQIIEGLSMLIDNLQEDNKAFRDEVKYLTERIKVIISECDRVKTELQNLQRKYSGM